MLTDETRDEPSYLNRIDSARSARRVHAARGSTPVGVRAFTADDRRKQRCDCVSCGSAAMALAVAIVLAALMLAALSAAGSGAGRRSAGARRTRRRVRGADPAVAAGSSGRLGTDRHQLSDHVGHQPVGVRRRTGRDRLRRRAVPARRRHQRACGASRRSGARAVHRARTGDHPRPSAGPGRGDAHRHAECAGHADAPGTLSRRRRAGSADDHADSCARARRSCARQ